jgi:hypothetical protein
MRKAAKSFTTEVTEAHREQPQREITPRPINEQEPVLPMHPFLFSLRGFSL